MKKVKVQSTTNKKADFSLHFKDFWARGNYFLLLLAILILTLGYYLMTFSPWSNNISLNISPIVLLIGYVIVIPLSIFLKFNKNNSNDSRNS